ncbi:MAG: hypothetical protein ABI619_14455, partial [Betaproteobacteria bacterium]
MATTMISQIQSEKTHRLPRILQPSLSGEQSATFARDCELHRVARKLKRCVLFFSSTNIVVGRVFWHHWRLTAPRLMGWP